MDEPPICIGAISGTSMDCIDVAALRTDGKDQVERLGFGTHKYPQVTREKLRALGNPPDPLALDEIEPEVTGAFVEAIRKFMRSHSLGAPDVALVGSHGQTVHHDPAAGITIQLCNNARLAHELRIDVIGDFRAADVKAGGEGAPLAPLYHRALAAGLEKPVVFLNLGGVGNLTYVGEDGELLAFDTGPANALLDDLVRERLGRDLDEGGDLAASGKVDERLVGELVADPWFEKGPPKSLDRNHFRAWLKRVEGHGTQDAAATLAALTAVTVAMARAFLPAKPVRWLVSGGGRHNLALMRSIQGLVKEPVQGIDEALGANGDAIEAETFAYLAMRSSLSLPISLPATTGVPGPMTGGRLYGKTRRGAK